MTPRSLFTIVLKIIGILFIRDMLDIIPQLILNISSLAQLSDSGDAFRSIIIMILFVSVFLCVPYYFIFKTNVIIDKLRLDNGFTQENFPLNIHRSTVLSIVIIIIGGLLIADNIPLLCRSVCLYYQNRTLTNGYVKFDFSYMIIYAIKILVGLILTGNHQLLVNYIERKRKAPVVASEVEIKDPE